MWPTDYFTNAEFEYQNARKKVESNEYMIAFKEWKEKYKTKIKKNMANYIFHIRIWLN